MSRFFRLCSILSICILASCNSKISLGNYQFYEYDNADKYSIGKAEISAQITTLDIDWVNGNINISVGPSEGVVFAETANQALTDELAIHYWQNGNTLYLKFSASGKMSFQNLTKDLTVYLPDYVLKDLNITNISGSVEVIDVSCENLSLETISSNAVFRQINVAQDLTSNSISGDVTIESGLVGNALEIDSTSGNIKVGDLGFQSFDIDTISGDVELVLSNRNKSGSVDTISGDIDILIFDNPYFGVTFTTTSGDINFDFAVNVAKNKYFLGLETNRYELDTISGNVDVKRKGSE